MARYKKDIADGMYCADCVGLIKGHYWDQDGKRVYDAKTDVSASGMYDRSPIKGLIKNLPEVPGLILYAPGHVGVYEGNGHVIEAKGFAHGIIRSKVSEGKWTHWCVCAYISYAGFEDKLLPTPITEPYTALVVTRSSPLNVWNDAKKTKSLLSVAKGDTILVLGYANAPGWFKVQKGAVKGVADSQYLQKVDMPTPQTDDDDAEVPIDHNHSGVLYQAKVVNVKTGLNLRLQPSQSGQTMLLIPLDAVVEVLQDNVADGFSYVCYGGVHGYCTRSYLYQMDSDMPAYYNILLRNATADVLARVLEICPAAEVTPVNG